MENELYQRDLLSQSILEMLNLCTSQFKKSIEGFINNDIDLAEEVIHREQRANVLDLKIEKDCERYLALFNPVAIDLRYIMAIYKFTNELERIADHAYRISKYVVEYDDVVSKTLFEVLDFGLLVQNINKMIDNVYDAFENENIKSARKVFKFDKAIDKINSNSFIVLEEEVKKDITIVSQSFRLISVMKKCERVGDLLKNIAEEIIFYKEAEVLKHRKKKR